MARIPYADETTDSDVAALAEQIRKARGGKLPNLYRMLLNSPPVARGWLNLLTAVRQQSQLRARYREMAIIRIAIINRAQYEYLAHIPFAIDEGMTQAEIDALSNWESSKAFTNVERAILAYTDSVTRDIQVPDEVFKTVAGHFDAREMTELTATIAAYNLVSRFLEAVQIDPKRDCHLPQSRPGLRNTIGAHMSKWTTERLAPYLLSLPERVIRSAAALASGLLREIGEVTIPRTVRNGQLYQNLVEATLQFLIEQVGQVQNVYPSGEKLSEEFLVRRTAGNGIEMIGILAFRASPVWVLAALADASGAGRYLVREIAGSLKDEGLLQRDTEFTTVDQMLDGLERSAGRLATTINTPPLDVATLRQEWESVRRDLSSIPPKNLPALDSLRNVWVAIKQEAATQNRTVFDVSSLMAMSAIASLPQKARWLSASARNAAGKTGSVLAGVLLDHYRMTLNQIHDAGYVRYAVGQFRPYLYAAVTQFSPQRRSLTERLLLKKRV